MAPPLRLLTIGFSHFCEKARWALDRAGLEYVEHDHAPVLHFAPNLLAGAHRTVPALVTPRGVLCESTDIVRFVDEALAPEQRLFPAEPALAAEVERLVADLDRRLGPATRRAVYWQVFKDGQLTRSLLSSTGPKWERRSARLLTPLLRSLIARRLRLEPVRSARSIARTEEILNQEIAARLADGRRYLVGDRFTAADLTFAALAAPALLPPSFGFALPPDAALPPALLAWIERMRATPGGQFALRLFADDRPPVRAQGRSDMS